MTAAEEGFAVVRLVWPAVEWSAVGRPMAAAVVQYQTALPVKDKLQRIIRNWS